MRAAQAYLEAAQAYRTEQTNVLDTLLVRLPSVPEPTFASINKVFHTGSEATQVQTRSLRSNLLSYEIHSRRNGVAVRNAADERTDADGKRYNSEVTGGVLQYSWFAAASNDYETAADAIGAYAMGNLTPSNPAASASYNGLMVAAALANTGENVHMTGNAHLNYTFASDTLSVRFGEMQIVQPSDYSPPPDLIFNDLPVVDGEFNEQGVLASLDGGFFGTEHSEVAGVFHYVFPAAEREQYEQMHGAFGASP